MSTAPEAHPKSNQQGASHSPSSASPYIRTMSALRLSPTEKEALVNTLVAQHLSAEAAVSPQGLSPAERPSSEKAGSPAPAARASRTRTHSTAPRRAFVGLAAAATLTAAAAGIAAATGLTSVDVPDLIARVFSRSQLPGGPVGPDGAPVYFPDPVQDAAATSSSDGLPGAPIGVSASSGGVTITADSVIGDRNVAIIVFTATKDDGSPFNELGIDSMFGSPELLFQGSNITLDDEAAMQSWGCMTTTYDANPNDNALQLICAIHAESPLVGATVNARFVDLAAMDKRDPATDGPGNQAIRRTVIHGTWELSFPLSYEDRTLDVDVTGQTFPSGPYKITVASLSVSPVSVHIGLHAQTESDQTGPDAFEELARVLDLPVSLVLDSGEAVDIARSYPGNERYPSLSSSGTASLDTKGVGEVQIARYTPRVIDVARITAVRLGSIEIPVTAR